MLNNKSTNYRLRSRKKILVWPIVVAIKAAIRPSLLEEGIKETQTPRLEVRIASNISSTELGFVSIKE